MWGNDQGNREYSSKLLKMKAKTCGLVKGFVMSHFWYNQITPETNAGQAQKEAFDYGDAFWETDPEAAVPETS